MEKLNSFILTPGKVKEINQKKTKEKKERKIFLFFFLF